MRFSYSRYSCSPVIAVRKLETGSIFGNLGTERHTLKTALDTQAQPIAILHLAETELGTRVASKHAHTTGIGLPRLLSLPFHSQRYIHPPNLLIQHSEVYCTPTQV